MSRTHYDVLGVVPTAPDSVIKAAYRARIRETHPDAGGNQQDAQAINDAWSVLQDADSRARYDRSLQDEQPSARSWDPDEHRTSDAGESRGFTPREMPASAVYSTFARPPRWFRTKLVWISAASAVLAAVVSGLFGVSAAPALLSVGALVAHLVPQVRARQIAALAVLGALAMIFLGGEVTVPRVLTCAIPAAAATTAIGMTALARRREEVQTDLHIGDTVITTAEVHGIALAVVVDAQRLSDTSGVIAYDDGAGSWPLPTARTNGHVQVGDVVVAERGTVIAWASDATVLRARKALAKRA